ncbi:signal peptidase II [Candidatus Woesearchaeota archaeon]|nr:signal peptidase II [Candidatus Woesearchaeota archaeon]
MAAPKTYRMMNFIENNLSLLLVSVAIIIVERIIKFYVTEYLRIGESIPVLGSTLMITRAENVGAGFGILRGYNLVFILAAAAVLILIIYFYNQIIYDRLLVFSFAFLLGGTVGNMMDRLFFGHVIDYVDLSFWPTFNLSDLALTTGAVLLIIYMYMVENKPEEKAKYIHY